MSEQFKTIGQKDYKVIVRFNEDGTPEFWSSLLKKFTTDFTHADLFSIDSNDSKLLGRPFDKSKGSVEVLTIRKVDILVMK